MIFRTLFFLAITLVVGSLQAETIFIEAEHFDVPETGGWTTNANRTASSLGVLHGASGNKTSMAQKTVTLKAGGLYRIWVRYLYVNTKRGPFDLNVLSGGDSLAQHSFDVEAIPEAPNWDCIWKYFDAELSAGEITLKFSKHDQKNCSGYTRKIDCILLTTDLKITPDHRDFGPQTYVRVTIGDIDVPPVYIHIFADHFRRPWYSHHHLSKVGAGNGLKPAKCNLLKAEEQTPWCNITHMLYQDSGAILNITVRYTYHTRPDRMKARFEFATAPDASAIVRTMNVDAQPNGLIVIIPPDLTTELNRSRFGRDIDFAEKVGQIADAYD